jgi:hypothetical protein
METQSTTPIRRPNFVARLVRGGKPFAARWLRRLLPTPGNILFTLLIVGALFWAQSAGAFPLPAATATSTSIIAYQGRLVNAAGQPITSKQIMKFRIYDTATGNLDNPLWTETWTGETSINVVDGLFNVMLGTYTPGLASVIQSHTELYLGITVGSDNEMSPRVQLGSAPYGMQTLTVVDNSVTGDKIVDSSVMANDLAANSVTGDKIVDSSIMANDLAANSVTGDKIVNGSVTQSDAPGLLQGQANNSALRWGNVVFIPDANGRTTIYFPAFPTLTDSVVAVNGDVNAGHFLVEMREYGANYFNVYLSNLDGTPRTVISRILYIAIGH